MDNLRVLIRDRALIRLDLRVLRLDLRGLGREAD